MIRITAITIGALLAIAGCAASEGTHPHDMSVQQHEASAGHEQQLGAQHEQQYDPNAQETSRKCEPHHRGCWTSVTNPTQEHLDMAREHHELAQKHRAAAQALRDAEAQSCAGLDEDDRDMSPFAHKEDIAAVRKIERPVTHGKVVQQQLAGGAGVFRAVPGMTAEWLQRVASCHLARAAAVGFNMPEMGYCPLMIKGAAAHVSSDPGGFAIEVTSDDPAAASEIWRRLQALGAPQQ